MNSSSDARHAFRMALVVGMAVGAAAALFAAPRIGGQPSATRIGQADIVIERTTYDGHIQYTGYLTRLIYGADVVVIEFTDDTDGIYRNGFDAQP